MLNNSNVEATIGVKDLNAARNFYGQKLGLTPIKEEVDKGVLLYKSGNTVFQVYKSEFAGTSKTTALTWTVGENISKEVKDLKNKGISFEHYDIPDAKVEEGDIYVMGDMKAAWFKDPDGNILCIHDHD